MSEHFDRDKFSGGTPPPKPPQQNHQDDWDWIRWPLIIILFSMGLWPLAFIAMAYFSKNKRKRRQKIRYSRQEADARVARALEQAEKQVAYAFEQTQCDGSAAQSAVKNRKKEAQRVRAQSEHTVASGNNKREKVPGKALRIVGICLLVMGAVLCMDAVPSLLQGHQYVLSDLFSGLGFLAGGGISLGRAEYLRKLSNRTRRYVLAIGAAESMRMDEIAKRVNRTPEQAKKELQKLIDNGYLGDDAYIDHEKGYFLRFGAVPEEDVREEAEMPKEKEEDYSVILRSLRTANERIPSEEMSSKIDRLEQISAQIFRKLEVNPEKKEKIRIFFDYYLPTTQKLLDTYAEFDEMGLEGEDLTRAKQRIEEMMDPIVEGFEHQLKELYRADAVDVVGDINVMETILNRDMASVEKDFGYDSAKKAKKTDEMPEQMGM